MRSVLTKLDKLNSQLVPNDSELWRAQIAASDKPTQEELDAFLALTAGHATREQRATFEGWQERNLHEVAAVWDARLPRWRETFEEPEDKPKGFLHTL